MGVKIVYFSRSGTCKKIGYELGKKLSCEVIEIKDNKDWKGFLGILKGSYYAISGKDVEISLSGSVDSSDELVVITPLWAGRIVPAVKKFLSGVGKDKVSLVVCSNGSTLENRSGYNKVYDIVSNKNKSGTVIKEIVDDLSK